MKVVVLNASLEPVGGTELYARAEIAELTARGHDVVAVSSDRARPAGLAEAARWVALPPSFFGFALNARAFRVARVAAAELDALLARERPDVAAVHLFDSPRGLDLLVKRVPSVFFVHTAWPYCPAGTRWLRTSNTECAVKPGLRCVAVDRAERCLVDAEGAPYSRRAILRRLVDVELHGHFFRRATLVAANSPYTARQVRTLLGRDDDGIVLLPPPIPASRAAERAPIRGRLLVVGRLMRGKGIADAIRTTAALADQGASLAIAGRGPDEADLRRLAADLGVADRVAFLGWMSDVAVDDEIRKSEVVLFPSHWPETFGQVGARAGANGRPVVAYDRGGASAWLSEEWGRLVPADVDAMTRAVREILRDPALARRLGEAGLAASGRFDLPAFGARIEAAFARAAALGVGAARRGGVRLPIFGGQARARRDGGADDVGPDARPDARADGAAVDVGAPDAAVDA